MHLDMLTMSAVSFTVTSILGIVLIFTWARAGATSFVGWWGFALLLQSAGVAIAATSSVQHGGEALTLGQATMILANAVKWQAARLFADRNTTVFWAIAGSVGFLLVAHSGLVEGFADRLILACAIMALYNFAAAIELSYANGEHLTSRWPAVALLVLTGAGYLSWLPLIFIRPIESASAVFSSSWFPVVILGTLLLRVALAFIVLSMAKERQELERRTDALTDSLTGLPNRRALFEAADNLTQRNGTGGPISVLLFDLDHFKEINDTFGHDAGDRVLKLFAATVSEHLNGSTIIARLGGEEFAAIMLKTDLASAALAAEVVRRAFAKSAAVVDGIAIGGTVSVGAASDMHVGGDLSALFRRADAALYAAKRAGRNRVELLENDDGRVFSDVTTTVRSSGRRTPASIDEPRSIKVGT